MTSTNDRENRLRILHLILVLRSTNSQYNEHSLPVMDEREITLCTYFKPQLVPPPQIRVFAGNDSVRGFFRVLRDAPAPPTTTPFTRILLRWGSSSSWPRSVGCGGA